MRKLKKFMALVIGACVVSGGGMIISATGQANTVAKTKLTKPIGVFRSEGAAGRSARLRASGIERKVIDWKTMSKGQILFQGQLSSGQCNLPEILVMIPKPPQGMQRYYRLKQDENCRIVVDSVGSRPAPKRSLSRLTLWEGSEKATGKNLLFNGSARVRKTQWYMDSLDGTGYIQFIGDSPNASTQSAMDYQYDVEWPGGLVALNGASANCDDDGTAQTQVCADPYFYLGIESGPGSYISYGASNEFDVPSENEFGWVETGFVINGYGEGFCSIRTYYHGGSHQDYAGGDCL